MSRQPGWYDISEGRPWVCSARRNTYPQLAEKINANVYKGLIHVNTTVKEQVYWQMPYTARFLTILLQFISLNIPIRALNTFLKKKRHVYWRMPYTARLRTILLQFTSLQITIMNADTVMNAVLKCLSFPGKAKML